MSSVAASTSSAPAAPPPGPGATEGPRIKTSSDGGGPKIAASAKLPPGQGKRVDIHA